MAIQVYSFVKDDKGIYRPWVPIRIVSAVSNKHINSHALLDTGADECVFPNYVAEQTGIELKAPGIVTKEMQGVSADMIKVWFHQFKVQLLSPDLKKIFWSSKEITVGCVDHDRILPILGFGNCMGSFKITFNHASRKIIIDDKPSV
jgi:hypothetical protein